MPELFDINDKWNEQPWFSTGGTRAKKYLQSPDGKFYYFKRSQYKEATATKPGKHFQYEFWSEVIAYEVGTLLGFDILRYDVATLGDIMGCISESMINEQQELIEGVKYLQAFAPLYEPENKEHHNWYTFQLIENALGAAKLAEETDQILEMIILDALIGNGDRHQENWAIISQQRLITEIIRDLEKEKIFTPSKIMRFLINTLDRLLEINKASKIPKSLYKTERGFAPIYDNGSSLGRELLDERVDLFLNSSDELNKYIDRGMAEIHWDSKKVSHFELIGNLMVLTRYKKPVKSILSRVIDKWNGPEIERIIGEIDLKVPETHKNYKIPSTRKQLIFKIITLRYERLKNLLNEGIR